MITYIQALKRCCKQRFEDRKQSSKIITEFTKTLRDITIKILTAAHELRAINEIIRTAIIGLKSARSEFNV